MKKTALIAFVVAALLASAAKAEFRYLELPYEFSQLNVNVNAEGVGDVRVKECDTCDEIALQVTPQTKAYKGEREIPLANLPRYRGQEGVLFRDPESRKVLRIRIY